VAPAEVVSSVSWQAASVSVGSEPLDNEIFWIEKRR
jgi:hypothetical protein